MAEPRRVHVVSFSPSDERAAVGGFDWYYELAEARTSIQSHLATESGIHNLALVHLDIPGDLDRDEITSWIDSRLHLIEPAGNHGSFAYGKEGAA